MVNLLVWLMLGALLGWIGSAGGERAQRWSLNIGLGIIGAVVGGLGFYRFDIAAATGDAARLSLNALLIAFIGAISLLTIVNALQHGDGREA